MLSPDCPLVLGGRYRLLSEIGRGGAGVVYMADDLDGGGRVAVKVLLRTHAAGTAAASRFEREIRAMRLLDAPGFVRMLDAGSARELDDAPFLVMELLRGHDLEQLVTTQGRRSPGEVQRWLGEVAETLELAHARGLSHRDLKPANLFLALGDDGRERVKILDLGLVKAVDPGALGASGGITATGTAIGTPIYMAPEQARGRSDQIGPAADVWAIGLIAVRLLTGDIYWTANSMAELMAALLVMRLYPPSTRWRWLPPAFDAWFLRSCDRDPAGRFPSVRQQSLALRAALEGSSAAAEPPGAGGPASRGGGVSADMLSTDTIELAGTVEAPPQALAGGAHRDSDRFLPPRLDGTSPPGLHGAPPPGPHGTSPHGLSGAPPRGTTPPPGSYSTPPLGLFGSPEAERPRHNLPVQRTPFVGRARERAEIAALLLDPRAGLLTLTGVGGTGKTRLALQVAEELVPAFPGGVCFVPLASLCEAALVPSAIAQALCLGEGGARPDLERVVQFLRDRRLLLLLDNLEHLTAAAPAIAHLAASCPHLSLLVTSRAALNLSGERRYVVPPLEVPEPRDVTVDAALASSAVSLFCRRAAAIKPGFQLGPDNAAEIVEICARLDGLPLAIELAASRLRVLTPAALLSRFGDRGAAGRASAPAGSFRLLTGGARDLPERQQTMRAAIDWSYGLLDPEEQLAFRTLAVFAGGFSLAMADQMCAFRDPALDALGILESLIDKSLVLQVAGEEPRFQMLTILREYGLDRLAEEGAAAACNRRFVELSLELADRAAEALGGTEQAAWLAALDLEHDNLRLALELALAGADAGAAVRLAAALSRFWYIHGHYQEGRAWLGRALAGAAGVAPEHVASALRGAGRLALLQCDYREARALLERGATLYRELGDEGGLASVIQILGSVAREQGDYERALALHGESLALATRRGDTLEAARALGYSGFAAWLSGDTARAEGACRLALPELRRAGDREGTATALLYLGCAALYRGELGEAARLCEESEGLSRQVKFKEGIAWTSNILGLIAIERGDLALAERRLRASLRLHRELGDLWRSASVLEALARAAVRAGKAERGARLLGGAAALREDIGTPVPPIERPALTECAAAARAALGGAVHEACLLEGRGAGLDATIAAALSE
ncbi:protein kinase domain-containing protein [Sorangium atrum]|uniref:Protein kinase n=1 Tax=Sorangium atrum TaxID=2995308 RepID=A0ABT5BT86_9BACT|nr:protein kinase [Sorangium aterium]MDC0677371.1 protein kinase [Sorangium aterium]